MCKARMQQTAAFPVDYTSLITDFPVLLSCGICWIQGTSMKLSILNKFPP